MANYKRSRGQSLFDKETVIPSCQLCNSHHHQLSSPAEWKSEEARAYVFSLQVSPQSLVCRPCRKDVTRVLANSKHTPRWAKNSSPVEHVHNCCVHNCGEAVFCFSNVSKCRTHETCIFSTCTECGCDEIPVPTPPCKYHYYIHS